MDEKPPQLPLPIGADPGRTMPMVPGQQGAGDPLDPILAPADLPNIDGFTLLAPLAEGGMGIIYRAIEKANGRTVALKMIQSEGKPSPEELRRFREEIHAVAAINHPHVVRVFASGYNKGHPFLAMEYLPGGNLADLLKKKSKLPLRTAAEMIRKIALAVQAAHGRKVVHRDLKPANILFDAAGEPKITDFGLAKRNQGGLTSKNVIMGTAAYMAPEQARGDSKFVGPAADVWALGVLLYECLTGVQPFTGAHSTETLQNVTNREPDPPRKHNPQIPRPLEMIVLHCLVKDQHARYGSAGDLAEDLRRWLDNEPVKAALDDVWQVRFAHTGSSVKLARPGQVLEGLRNGDWEVTDEVRGPDDDDWRPIEDHPTFADAASELDPPRIEPPDETKLDMNPLIDVALVLLIFFILTTSYASLKRSIDVPAEPDDAKGQQQNNPRLEDLRDIAFTVTVWMDGDTPRIKVEDQVVGVKDLERAILDQVRSSSKHEIILSVDGKVPWGIEAAVHDAAKAAEIGQIYRKKYKPGS